MKNLFKSFFSLFFFTFVFAGVPDQMDYMPLISQAILNTSNPNIKDVRGEYAIYLVKQILEITGISNAIQNEEQQEKIKILVNEEFLKLTKIVFDKQLGEIRKIKKTLQRTYFVENVLNPIFLTIFVFSKFANISNEDSKSLKFFSAFSESSLFSSIIFHIMGAFDKGKLESSLSRYDFAKGPENIKLIDIVSELLMKNYRLEIINILAPKNSSESSEVKEENS
jgi:hypothetical protein